MPAQVFTVIDPMEINEYDVQLPTDATMQKLIPELITALKLQPGSYAVQHVKSSRILGPHETLDNVGAKQGDVLKVTITPKAAKVTHNGGPDNRQITY